MDDEIETFKDFLVAHLTLKLLSNNFELSSNNEQFGVILQLEDNQVYAIQLKHSNKSDNLTTESVKKYCDEYKKLNFDNRTKCVLFTNLKYELSDESNKIELSDNVWAKIIKTDPDPVLNTSEEGCCYIVETDEIFKNFVVYTNQADVDVLKMKVLEQFEDKQSFENYIDFVTEWGITEGKKPKLDKTTMARVLTLCVLSENIVPFSFEDCVDQNCKLLRDAMSGFGITVIKPHSLDIVKRVYSDGDKELTDIDTINRVGAKYQVISQHVSDISDLGDIEKTKLLWLLGKFPLIVTKEPMLCDSGKFTVLGEETTKGEFQTLLDLDSTSSIYGEILDNFHISIQGRETPLRTLIEESDNFRAIITLDELLEMTGTFSIGDKSEELPAPYIDRLISINTIDPKFLEDIKNDTLVVINGHFVHTRKEIELELEEQVVYITDKDQFENVCKRHPRKRNYHYFKAIGGKLEWVQSLGDIQELQNYLVYSDFVPESEFSRLERKVEVVCAEPGMGKSILMKSIKNRQPTWTILIHPKEHASFLTTNIFIEYIIDLTKKQKGSFQSKFLEILIKERKVTFIWDGLDEVPTEYQDAVIVLIKDLQQEGFYQFVSARNHLRKKLESELNTLARTIKPIDQAEQAEYIKERFGITIRCHHILEVPLHVYMLTELLLRNWDKYKETVLQNILPITDLYSYFIDEKFNIYCREKLKLDDTEDHIKQLIQTTKRDRLENYKRAALNLVFKDSRNIHSSFLEDIRNNSDCCGIITSVSTEGVPTFIHQSFGEYFVAKYLVKNYRSVDIELLFTEEFTNIRFFFDLLLAQNHPVHLAVLYKNLEVLPNYLDNFQDVDDGGRSPLHLACSWGEKFYTVRKKKGLFGSEEIDTFWSQKETFENQQIIQIFCGNCDPYQVDDVFKMDAFSYANKSSSLFPMLALARIHQRNVKDFDSFKDTNCVLLQSAKLGYTEIFDVPDLSKIIGDHLHPLLVSAVEWNSPSVLKRLLYGRDYKFQFGKDDKSYSIVNLACTKGSVEIIRLLSHADVDFNTAYSNGIPPLYLLCQHGHLEAVKILIDEFKVDINCQDLSGNTPILAACAGGHFDIVKFLMERKVNFNHLNKMGTGILIYATHSANVEIVTYFLELGVDPRLKNKKGVTPLHIAALSDNVEIAQILMGNGAKIDAATENGVTPLHLASERGRTQFVGLLLDNRANPHLQNKEGCTPLHLASSNGHVEVVRLLIAVQARVDTANRNGTTPLFAAVREGHSEVVKVLVAAGADVDCRNQHKSTPLHIACENGNVEVVKVLLDSGADVSARTFFGRTAEQIARSRGFLEIVELLSKNTK